MIAVARLEKKARFRKIQPGTSLAVTFCHVAGLTRGRQTGQGKGHHRDVPFFCQPRHIRDIGAVVGMFLQGTNLGLDDVVRF